ncbi:Uma2 family endonuclease [Neolewinella sp.]|uniref:Uma2 family endonuclease n=1 Tax=Neolewinella sp. TaxID=2993543 RepID=UPI003B5244D4
MGIATAPYSAYDLLTQFGAFTFEQPMSLAAFTQFCEQYPDLIAEREAWGKVSVMSPVESASGENEGHVFGYVYAWNLTHGKSGRVYSPSTGFLLGGEAIRCGDTAWVSQERLAPFLADPDYRSKWVDVCPEFVVELKSESDHLPKLQQKMTDTWLANGTQLGWLIDPEQEVVYVYRAGESEPEQLRGFYRYRAEWGGGVAWVYVPAGGAERLIQAAHVNHSS